MARNLTRVFDGLRAVDAIHFEIQRGEIFGLLGPNGAGKTTTIKMLTTLLPISEREAWVASYAVAKEPEKVRQSIGYVSQMLSTDAALTGEENLRLSARLYGIPWRECRARIERALDFMGLQEAGHRLTKTYSGGMVRRLEIAQAMLHHPVLLFLDEQTIGLDPVARHMVWDRLKNLQSEFGMSVLMTTHDMEEADHLCNRLAIMYQGKLVAVGTPAELKAGIGPGASLDDVFLHYSGSSIDAEGHYHELISSRTAASRHFE